MLAINVTAKKTFQATFQILVLQDSKSTWLKLFGISDNEKFSKNKINFVLASFLQFNNAYRMLS